jgi:hypothetical protein
VRQDEDEDVTPRLGPRSLVNIGSDRGSLQGLGIGLGLTDQIREKGALAFKRKIRMNGGDEESLRKLAEHDIKYTWMMASHRERAMRGTRGSNEAIGSMANIHRE